MTLVVTMPAPSTNRENEETKAAEKQRSGLGRPEDGLGRTPNQAQSGRAKHGRTPQQAEEHRT
jgi:hypothetical protein